MDAAVECVVGRHLVGWARDPGEAGPATVRLVLAGEVLAEAPARLFRPELLRAGIGHGHYGFRARLRRAVAPGHAEIVLELPRSGQSLRVELDLPPVPPPARAAVEALLERPPGWTVQHVLEKPGCLRLAANQAAMGAPRFVDMLFRFTLRRWPAPHEARFHAGMLERGEISPDELLAEVLGTPERADLDPALVSPWDPDFPFAPG